MSLEKYPEVLFYRDSRACLLTVLFLLGTTIGFGFGIHDLSHYDSLGYKKMSTVISYITNWAQIFSLFVMGCVAVISSWTNLSKLKAFIQKIRQIDIALEESGVEISYKVLRKKLFIQTGVSFLIPTVLSMVNCMMIKSSFSVSSSCYWFICFAPLLLLTLKELKFYNLMFLLKGKFTIINQQIAQLCEGKHPQSSTLGVFSKCSEDGILLVQKHGALIEQVRALTEIYSEVADCVDFVLDIFAMHLLTTTCTSFAVITIQSYNLFALVMHSLAMQIYEVVFTVAWIIVQIMVIGVNVIACSQTSNAMAETGKYLHKLRPKDDYGLLLQVIVSAVTTYLIIIIQFHLANLQLQSKNNNSGQ